MLGTEYGLLMVLGAAILGVVAWHDLGARERRAAERRARTTPSDTRP